MTRQWIYVHDEVQRRLPADGIDATTGIRRPLQPVNWRKRPGLTADRRLNVGAINCADSFTDHRDHAFLATGLRGGSARPEAGEADLEVHLLTFDEAFP